MCSIGAAGNEKFDCKTESDEFERIGEVIQFILLTGRTSFCLSWCCLNIPIMVNVHNPHHRTRTLTQRGQGNQRSDCLYFALPSEQAVNLCSASAYLAAWHRSPAQGERHHTLQPSLLLFLLLLLHLLALFSLADWRRWLQIELFSPFHFWSVCIYLQFSVTSLLLSLFPKWKPFGVCLSLLHHLPSAVA